MNGKSKCKILKDIRKQIAQNNDIEFVTAECKYQGDCLGTCPKCEAEVRYLEAELLKRRQQGKNIAVAGLAAALVATSVGCSGDKVYNESSTPSDFSEDNSAVVPTESDLLGIEETDGEVVELQGDIIAPEYIIDPTSRPEKAKPDFEYFLTLQENEYLDYISGFSREELQTAWKVNLSVTSNKNHDYYLIFDNSVTNRLDVEYDSNNKVVSVEVIENYNSHLSDTTSRDSNSLSDTIMGSRPIYSSSDISSNIDGGSEVSSNTSSIVSETASDTTATPSDTV